MDTTELATMQLLCTEMKRTCNKPVSLDVLLEMRQEHHMTLGHKFYRDLLRQQMTKHKLQHSALEGMITNVMDLGFRAQG